MNSSLSLASQIEALLFFKGSTISITELATLTEHSADEVTAAVSELKNSLSGRGIRIVHEGGNVGLATAPEAAALIERIRREELEGPLGRAGLETLAVIMYRGHVTRADIEYIRGVNVSTTLRSLLIRGLVERIDNPKDKRSFMYRITPDVPAYLGVSDIKDLPEYDAVLAEITAVLTERDATVAEVSPEE